MLEIKNLQAGVEGKEILKGIDLSINAGEVHAIMGPNGSGKSTLAQVLAGREGYEIADGSVRYNGEDLLELGPEERVREGFFLAFQYPVEFLKLMREKIELLELDESLLKRSVNEGFSGGEKKLAEILQMALLDPKFAVLDETDSGLDIDALKVVAGGVNHLKRADNAQLVITHYQRLLDYIVPDHVHVLVDGRIVKSGPKELALELEERGYDWIIEEQAA